MPGTRDRCRAIQNRNNTMTATIPKQLDITESNTPRLGVTTTNRDDFLENYLDTPIGPPFDFNERYALAPGTCVKTFHATFHPDLLTGRVRQNEKDACIVIGHGTIDCPLHTFVWRGTREEMLAVWQID